MKDKISDEMLFAIAGFHEMPNGAVAYRKNGKSEFVNSTKDIIINKKENNLGIDIIVKSSCKGEICHMPVVVSEDDLFDSAYNDFYIEDNAVVTIISGCGVHSSTGSGHNGTHTFHVGKNAQVKYFETHLATGDGKNKELSPRTKISLGENSHMIYNTIQYEGVDFADRKTKVKVKDNAVLEINERIVTNRFQIAKTNFNVELVGNNSKCVVSSRSVAKDESEQSFKSKLVGKNACYGRVECDGILLNDAKIISVPEIVVENKDAELSHEASIGKIAGDQILKLMTLGKTEKEATEIILKSFYK